MVAGAPVVSRQGCEKPCYLPESGIRGHTPLPRYDPPGSTTFYYITCFSPPVGLARWLRCALPGPTDLLLIAKLLPSPSDLEPSSQPVIFDI